MTEKKASGSKGNGTLDLASLDTVAGSNEGAELVLMHPATNQPLRDDKGEDITLTLAGIDSDAYRKAQRAAIDRRLAAAKRSQMSIEELEAEQIEILAHCTLGWRGIVMEGEALDCTPANARRLYQQLPWVREQADGFIAERANFIRT